MPYRTVSGAREKISSLKDYTDKQVEKFIDVFNSLLAEGMSEKEAIPLALSQVKDEIEKATTEDVERDEKGNLVYSGHKFAGYNKPRKSSRDGKDGMVLAKKGDQVKLVHFGDSSMPHNQSSEANDRYYDRFDAGNTDKFSAEYWSNKWLWPRGDMKGKGGKPWVSLKKSSEETMSDDIDKQRDPSDPMKLVDEEDKVEKYKKKKKREVSKSFIDKMLDLFQSEGMDEYEYVLDDEQDISKSSSVTLVKQLEEEEMIAIEPLYIKAGDVDAHGDSITEDEVYKMVDNFNKNIDNIKGNIHHKMMTDAFKPLRAFVAPADMYIGNIEKQDEMVLVPKGQPIVEVKFADTEEGRKLWEDRKAGVVKGVSIGAQGVKVPNPDYSEEDDE